MKRSLKRRITLVLTSLVSLAVCVTAVLTYGVYLHVEKKMVRDLIDTESKRLVPRVSRFGDEWTSALERDMAPSMYVWGESPKVRAASLPDELRGLSIGLHELPRAESTWHVAVVKARDGLLYVVYDTVVLDKQRQDFTRALLAIVLGCSIFAMLLSGTVARWLVMPLNALTGRLTRWVPNSVAVDSPHANEADRLMEVFNRVQDQVDAAIADQREFSANLHHEIRTALTVIRSDAELMLRYSTMGLEQRRPRLERIVKSVNEIGQSLESTFSLAHARFEDKARVDIHACVEDIFESQSMEAHKAGLEFVNAVQPGHEETISRQALMTVMRNIVRNAVLHAAPARLTVSSIGHGLRFADSGPGIAPSELPHVFDRYFSNRRADQRQHEQREPGAAADMNQAGIGLAIAKRVCIMQSWTLDVASPASDGGGTCFTLFFGQEA
ncbi:sensor histidine kinase [Thauera linaloolentis]|uniref:histidine kinase n=1 Tax=Thauera linaloolentis (strain DSM 12138 / JCM 21573 / CCUG 41526 / CIP 105981 / IAM 15112 / NBRC 102519 / 47Lol) TaxID=1123367 RepID=N6YS80_THAL4|nr:HAMP domain-containing sensor histidine kinase [Thauera linaloolentis]ENO85227.1 two-component system sensor kinase [Thauera linaloolentis 47Lol = DSM 12138]MCM8565104.1 HAMP domain-containing histidine kinase [Thauera linaloolentis]